MDNDKTLTAVRQWVESVVVGLNLCPFAKRELDNNRIRFKATEAIDEEQLLSALKCELELIDGDPSIENTLLVHPNVLKDFFDYNQFLNYTDALLVELNLEGVFQLASFHPDYQFEGTEFEDAENYSNRSPFPMLHILREDSLERAIDSYPDADQIPIRNIEHMNKLGREKLKALLQACMDE